MESVQDVIESLAQSLQRSVAVDDADLRLVASSTHFNDADAARMQSLVGRRVEGDAREYVLGSGARRWREPREVPANPSIGADAARFCLPLWSRYELLGFLWVTMAGPLTNEEMAECIDAAETVRSLLVRRAEQEVEDAQKIQPLVTGLLSTSPAERAAAAAELIEQRFPDASRFTVVAAVTDLAVDSSGEAPVDLVRRALSHVQRSRLGEMSVVSVNDEVPILIIGHRTSFSAAAFEDLCQRVSTELRRLDLRLAERVSLGVGSTRTRLDDIALSFDQALSAARIALQQGQRVSVWGEDALTTLLTATVRPIVDRRLLPPVLSKVELEQADAIDLVAAYLRNAGNVIRTAHDLHLHRTTVYYHLTRFREVTGLDLDDGETRLMLHLWLKVRDRLAPE
ncbi:helix-turn-helix domain-containing protein [Microbacterium sp. KR10-403]|uniref:PucR family transcriptional regulator n=1 Tax=Microbacterium sp. KR10-403 TaxID=3158581 RepID=UPI0032E42ADD